MDTPRPPNISGQKRTHGGLTLCRDDPPGEVPDALDVINNEINAAIADEFGGYEIHVFCEHLKQWSRSHDLDDEPGLGVQMGEQPFGAMYHRYKLRCYCLFYGDTSSRRKFGLAKGEMPPPLEESKLVALIQARFPSVYSGRGEGSLEWEKWFQKLELFYENNGSGAPVSAVGQTRKLHLWLAKMRLWKDSKKYMGSARPVWMRDAYFERLKNIGYNFGYRILPFPERMLSFAALCQRTVGHTNIRLMPHFTEFQAECFRGGRERYWRERAGLRKYYSRDGYSAVGYTDDVLRRFAAIPFDFDYGHSSTMHHYAAIDFAQALDEYAKTVDYFDINDEASRLAFLRRNDATQPRRGNPYPFHSERGQNYPSGNPIKEEIVLRMYYTHHVVRIQYYCMIHSYPLLFCSTALCEKGAYHSHVPP